MFFSIQGFSTDFKILKIKKSKDSLLTVKESFKSLSRSISPEVRWLENKEFPTVIKESFFNQRNRAANAIIYDINADGRLDLMVLAQKLDENQSIVISIYQSNEKGSYDYREVGNLGSKKGFTKRQESIIGTSGEYGFTGYLTLSFLKRKTRFQKRLPASRKQSRTLKIIRFEVWGSMISQSFIVTPRRLESLNKWQSGLKRK